MKPEQGFRVATTLPKHYFHQILTDVEDGLYSSPAEAVRYYIMSFLDARSTVGMLRVNLLPKLVLDDQRIKKGAEEDETR